MSYPCPPIYIPDIKAGIDYGKLKYISDLLCCCIKAGLDEDFIPIDADLDTIITILTNILAKMDNPADPMVVEDTGVNTNPRKYEKTKGFVSQVMGIPVANTPVPIWAVGTPGVNPVGGRTAVKATTVYTFDIINRTGQTARAWLELNGVRFTIDFHINDGETLSKDWLAGLNIGYRDIQINSNVAGLSMQIAGTEE